MGDLLAQEGGVVAGGEVEGGGGQAGPGAAGVEVGGEAAGGEQAAQLGFEGGLQLGLLVGWDGEAV